MYDEIPRPNPISVQTIKVPAEKNRYKKAAAVTKEINNLASTMSGEQYEFYMEQLIALKNNMENPNRENEDTLDMTTRQISSNATSEHERMKRATAGSNIV